MGALQFMRSENIKPHASHAAFMSASFFLVVILGTQTWKHAGVSTIDMKHEARESALASRTLWRIPPRFVAVPGLNASAEFTIALEVRRNLSA